MRSDEERLDLIHQRVGQIRKKRRKQKMQLTGILTMACSLVLIVFLGTQIPALTENFAENQVEQTTAAASLIGNGMTGGYILMGIAAFLLGIGVTVFLFSLRGKERTEQ